MAIGGLRWRYSLTASVVVAQVAAAATVSGQFPAAAPVIVVSLAMLGFCAAPMTAWAQTLRMRAAPPEMHGRLFGLLRTTMQATPPAGAALAGAALTAGTTVTVAGIIVVMAVPALALAPDLLRRQ